LETDWQVGVLRRPAGPERHLTDDRAIKSEMELIDIDGIAPRT
jgi:hypothetical protein